MAKASRMVVIEREVSHYSTGHMFSYTFSLPNQILKIPWAFREEFKVECRSKPSSWSCEILFHKVLEDGKVSIPVTLERTDSSKNAVKVVVHPQIGDGFGRHLPDSWKLKKNKIRGGGQIQKTLEGEFDISVEWCYILELQWTSEAFKI
ncbi:unnamed protein product [Larinioides sclopetarius]|uniref:Uncharacterized protein n=1 Tax=Larinioides sclopetarius TaxID=280406 RepID=A0AAV2BDB1_9ARAC